MVNGRKELLTRLADKEGEFFVLISACTREPYVECDEETFDDKVFLYFDGEEAKQAAQTLAGKKIPVTVTRLESIQIRKKNSICLLSNRVTVTGICMPWA